MKEIIIYTDGACSGNPGPGGYGVILRYKNTSKELSGGFRLTTNNRMEIKAAIVGLCALKERCSVKLFSDSQYLVNGINKGWAKRWKANNWMKNKKEKALNTDLWEKLLNTCEGHLVEFIWVRGHSGSPENERCDILARNALLQENLSIDEGFEKMKFKPSEPIDNGNKYEQTDQTNCKMIKYEGRAYMWTGKTWVDSETFISPPIIITNKLNKILLPHLEKEENGITDVRNLLDRAKYAKAQALYTRAEGLSRKALQVSPGHFGALAILCSCLRSLNKPEEVLKETAPYRNKKYPPLIITRAAALCDLGRWKEAKSEVGKALAICRTSPSWKNLEAFSVVNRIKAERPDLYM